MKVLIAEDSNTMRGIVREMMRRLGYNEIVEAEDGQQAWEQLNQGSFDLLLTDWNMPRMSGLELLQKVRESPDLAEIPVVMLTTRNNKEDIVSAMKAGINNYVTKPCKPTQLKEKIDKALIHAKKKNKQPVVTQRDPEELIKGSRKHHPSQFGPYVLCYEAPFDLEELVWRRDESLQHTYEVIADAVELLNEEFPGLELGYNIEEDSREFTRRVNSTTEPVRALMISARRPEGFSLARLTGFKNSNRIPVYLVCESIAGLSREQRAAASNVQIELIERRNFAARDIGALLRKHMIPEPEVRPSGLQFRELVKGSNKKPAQGSLVTVHYTGMLDDGSIFDSSHSRQQPFEFELGGGMILDGWDEGVALMHEGGRAQLVIPPALAYGAKGDGGAIPPNATLIFNVELMGIKDLVWANKEKVEEDQNEEQE